MRAPHATLACFLHEISRDRHPLCRRHSAEHDDTAESAPKKPGNRLARIKELAAHPGLANEAFSEVRSVAGLDTLRQETLQAFQGQKETPPPLRKTGKVKPEDPGNKEKVKEGETKTAWEWVEDNPGLILGGSTVLLALLAVLGARSERQRNIAMRTMIAAVPQDMRTAVEQTLREIGILHPVRRAQLRDIVALAANEPTRFEQRLRENAVSMDPKNPRRIRIDEILKKAGKPGLEGGSPPNGAPTIEARPQILEQAARKFIAAVETVPELRAIADTVHRNPTTIDQRSAVEVRAGTIAAKIWEAVLDGRIAPTVLDASMRDMLQNRTDMTLRQTEARAFIDRGWRDSVEAQPVREILLVPNENLEAARRHRERFPTGATEYVVGDTNANYEATLHNLEQARLVKVETNGRIIWIGGETRLVFIGDTIADRNEGGLQTWKLIDSLESQGAKIDKFHGNHETQGLFYNLFRDQLYEDTNRDHGENRRRVDYRVSGGQALLGDVDGLKQNLADFKIFRRQLASFKLIDYNPANGRLYVHTDPVNLIFTFLDSHPEYHNPDGTLDANKVNSTFQTLTLKAADHFYNQSNPPLTPEEATLFVDLCEEITHTNNRLNSSGSNAVDPTLLRKLFPGAKEIVHGHSDNATDEGGENKEFIKPHPKDATIRIVNTDTSFGKRGDFLNVGAEHGTPNVVGDFGEWNRLTGREGGEALQVGHEAHATAARVTNIALEATPESNERGMSLTERINRTDSAQKEAFGKLVAELVALPPEQRAEVLRHLDQERLDEVFRQTKTQTEMVEAINREIRIRDLVRIGTGTNTVQRTFLPESYTAEDMLAALDRYTTPESREQALARWEKMQVFQERTREARRLLPAAGVEAAREAPATVEAVRAEYRLLVEGRSTVRWTYFGNEGVEMHGGVVEVPLRPVNHQSAPFVGLRLANGMTVILPNPLLGYNQAMLIALFPTISQEQFSRSLADIVPTVAYPTIGPDGIVLAHSDLYDATTHQVRPYPVKVTGIEGLTLATTAQQEVATETPGARAWNRITQEWRDAKLDLATPQEIRDHIVTVFERTGTPRATAGLTEETARERSQRILENAINSWIEDRLGRNIRLDSIMEDLSSFHTDMRMKVDGTNAELAEAVETALETVQDARNLFNALHEGRGNGNLQRANERTRAMVSRMLLSEFARVGAEERDAEIDGRPEDRTRSDAIRKMIYKVDNAPFELMLPQPFKPENFEQLTQHFAGMVEGHLLTAEGSLARHFTNALARSGAAIEGANFQWNNAALNRAASWALETVMADHLDRQGAHLNDSQQLIDALRAFNVLPAETLDAMQVAHQRLDQLSRRLLRAVQGQPEGVSAAVTQAMAQFETFPADREIATRALRRLTEVTTGPVQENAKNALATLVPNEKPGTSPLPSLTPEGAANRAAMMEKLNASRLTALRQARIASEIMAHPDAREAWLNELRAIGEGKEPSADAATQDAARKIVNLVGQRLAANHNETPVTDRPTRTSQQRAAMRKSISQGSLRNGVVEQPGARKIRVVEAPGAEHVSASAANERRVFDSATDTLHRRATNEGMTTEERAKRQVEENRERGKLKERVTRRP